MTSRKVTYTCMDCKNKFESDRARPEDYRYCASCAGILREDGLGRIQTRRSPQTDEKNIRELRKQALEAAWGRADTKRPRPQPEGGNVTEDLNRTPIEKFILKVPKWRDKYLENNRSTFKVEAFIQRSWDSQFLSDPQYKDRYQWVEKRISELEGKQDMEQLEDDMEVVYHWGGGLGPRLFSQIMNSEKNSPSPTTIREQMRAAFDALGEGRPAEALEELKRLKYCSDAFGTKVLAMRSPKNAPIWDNIAQHCLREFTVGGKKVRDYEQFIAFCEHIADELGRLNKPAPRGGGRWYLRDIEMAIFQFGWDSGKFGGRITGEFL